MSCQCHQNAWKQLNLPQLVTQCCKAFVRLLKAWFHIRDEITVQNGLLFKANRVLVPPSLRKDILRRIHDGHLGIQSSVSTQGRDNV